MRLFIALLLSAVFCQEMAIKKEFAEHLKNTVDWEVADYEENVFRGWTVDEVQQLLGWIPDIDTEQYPEVEYIASLPGEIDWTRANCDHGVKYQGNCESCWAFAFTGMLSFRCCAAKGDHGWLSPQELVSCDKQNSGCSGGNLITPMIYIRTNGGLVQDSCFPYQAANLPCPLPWRCQHQCNCNSPVICTGTIGMQNCLYSGPASFGFTVVESFLHYNGGIYQCDGSAVKGGHAALAMGFGTNPRCYFTAKNSWGTGWGEGGYFKIGCTTCGLLGGVACAGFA